MIDSFNGYCAKYKIRNKTKIIQAFKTQKPVLKKFTQHYSWGDVKSSGYFFECLGTNISIEGSMEGSEFHVTFIGFEGVNADFSKYTFA